ncbi:endolytic transglycosylase MltG, partial [Bacteroidota bacterium]
AVTVIIGILIYNSLRNPNVWLNNQESVSIYIPTGASFDDVKSILYGKGVIINRKSFEWVAGRKDYPELIKPGHYVIKDGMSNEMLLNLLRSGNQTPVKVIFNNITKKEQLSHKIGKQLETDSLDLITLLSDSVYISKFGFTDQTLMSIFIPNTYEFYWNTSAEQFIERMNQEFIKFWTKERKDLADSLGLTPFEVITLASIVEKETAQNSEKPSIAGVYINRLNRNWFLQADPTLIFAMDDYGIKRVLNTHKNIDSPYNTYKYGGLPPGPICSPSISSIDAVLNYEDHNYLFFCARDDLSGFHVFAKTNAQHSSNARKYQRALDNLKIMK